MNSTNSSYPGWIPPEFRVPHNPNTKLCKTPGDALLLLGIYDLVEIALFILLNTQLLRKCLGRPKAQKPWSFSNVGPALAFEFTGMVLSSYFTTNSTALIWHNLQIWSVRPRITWFKGNMAQVNRDWGYMNDALSSVVMELIICSFSTYFVGNLLHHTWRYQGPDKTSWHTTMVAACWVMMISTAFEVIWAAYLLFRFCYTKGRGEADDMDSLKWIARTFVPVTCLCSWLIWAAYLYSSSGAYCPHRQDYINAVWIVAPFLTSGTQLIAGRL